MDRRTYIATIGSTVSGATVLSKTAAAQSSSDDGDDPDVRFESVTGPSKDVYTRGETVEVNATIKNYEPLGRTVYVGYSVSNDGRLFENGNRTDEAVFVGPGAKSDVELEWNVSSEAPPGYYGQYVKIWRDRVNNGSPREKLKHGLDEYDRTDERVFRVKS
ncbi:hypothetical protein ACOZ32_01910 [Halobacterium sp. MBLA0001]|uniref:hypothetical protein n=1 Tax=Halobacterium sp. MBLA0001 TaxID=3413511 RepID=UPI003C71B836